MNKLNSKLGKLLNNFFKVKPTTLQLSKLYKHKSRSTVLKK